MTSTEPDPSLAQLDRESGTPFNWADFPYEWMWTPDETHVRDVPDRTWVSEMETMLRRDGRAGAIYTALTMPLRSANITLDPAPQDAEVGQTDLIRSNLFERDGDHAMVTPLDRVISQMVHSCMVRRTFHEVVWKRAMDGSFVIHKLAWRPPSSVEVVRDRRSGDVIELKQWADWQGSPNADPEVDQDGYLTIPGSRVLIHVHNSHVDEMLGQSDMAVTKWAHDLKQKVIWLWHVFCGEQALPRTVVYGGDPKSAQENARKLSKLRGSGVIGLVRSDLSTGKMFDVVEGQSSVAAASQFQAMISYLEGVQAESVMAGWLELTGAAAAGKGSYALSADASGLFLASRHGAAKELADTLNRLIRRVVLVNFGTDVPPPKVRFEKISEDQVEKSLGLLSTLATAQSLRGIPEAFIDLLLAQVAQYLDLDDESVQKMVEIQRQERDSKQTQTNWDKLNQLDGAIDQAQQAIEAEQTADPSAEEGAPSEPNQGVDNGQSPGPASISTENRPPTPVTQPGA